MKRFIFLSLPLLILLGACEPVSYFTDYEDVNFIENYPFTSASWSVDYGDPVVAVNYDYMAATAAVYTTDFNSTSGLPSGTSDYTRLEIFNLAQNGDFEGGATGWTDAGAANDGGSTATVGTGAGYIISFNTLYLDLVAADGSDDFTYDIETGMTAAAGAAAYEWGAQYRYRGDFRSWTPLFMEFSANGADTQTYPPNNSGSIQDLNSVGINNTFIPQAANETLSFTGGVQEGALDNFRIIRDDISPRYILDLPLEIDDKPELISGYYRFSCYYRVEEAAEVSPAAANTFRAANLTIKMESIKNNAPVAQHQQVVALGSTPGSWQKVTKEGYLPIYSPSSGSDPVLRLSVTPTDLVNDNNAGRVLVAAPALEFSATPW